MHKHFSHAIMALIFGCMFNVVNEMSVEVSAVDLFSF